MPTLETYRGVYIWRYVPSLPLSVTFAAIFGIAATAHGWKMYKTQLWFCLPFVLGGFCEEVGYIARAAAWDATGNLVLYLVQAIFLLIPPVLFAATLYMVYSRVVRAVAGQNYSPLSPRWTTTIFVVGDFLTLSIQGNGSGLLGKEKTAKTGENIIVAGLVLQIILFLGFILCCVVFHTRFAAHLAATGNSTQVPWRSTLNMLYATSAVILVRNIYRVVEFVMGQDGYLFINEWPTYVFDAALMLLVMVAFYAWYPDRLQQNARDSMIELNPASEAKEAGLSEGVTPLHCNPAP